jgi:hypothetical protein
MRQPDKFTQRTISAAFSISIITEIILLIIGAFISHDITYRSRIIYFAQRLFFVIQFLCIIGIIVICLRVIFDIVRIYAHHAHERTERLILMGTERFIYLVVYVFTPTILHDIAWPLIVGRFGVILVIFSIFYAMAAIGLLYLKPIGRMGCLLLVWYEATGQVALWIHGFGPPTMFWFGALILFCVFLFSPPVKKLFHLKV